LKLTPVRLVTFLQFLAVTYTSITLIPTFTCKFSNSILECYTIEKAGISLSIAHYYFRRRVAHSSKAEVSVRF